MLKKSVSLMLALLMTLSVFVIAPFTASAEDEYGVDKAFGKTVGDYGKYSYDEDGNILMSVTMDKYLLYNENGISYFKGTHPAKITFGGLLPEVLSVGRKYTYFHNDIEMKGYWPTHSPIQYNLNIPYSVKEIAERSFWGFGIYDQKNELTGETNRYYDNYGAIVKVRMGKNVRKIGYRAFFNCGFTKLMLPRILRRVRRQIIHLRGALKTVRRTVFTFASSLTLEARHELFESGYKLFA